MELHVTIQFTVILKKVNVYDFSDTTYVDYAGTALYATSQIKAFQRDLFANLYGNPHSRNASSQLATDTIEQVRYRYRLWKEGNILFNDTLNTFYLRSYGIRHMVKDHSDSERGIPLPPHGLLFLIISKGSFICIIPQTG